MKSLHAVVIVFLCYIKIQMSFAGLLLPLNDWCYAWLVSDGTDCSAFYKSRSTQIQQLSVFGILEHIPVVEGLNKICCKDGTGCFTNALGSVWECYNVLPDCMDKIKPIFYVYTTERSSAEQIIEYSNLDASLKSLQINGAKQLFVIIHGFGREWTGKRWMIELKDALIALGNTNVMLVRWTIGADEANYVKAAANTQTVGAALARVIQEMVKIGKGNLSKTTIVGFSLGAHVAGYAGNRLPGLNRIVGLDPAGPMFTCQNESARLDASDANFVQIIHTNGDDFVSGGAGTVQQLGHVDFYANDGKVQPGCSKVVSQAVTDVFSINFATIEDDLACSHSRAVTLFIESVNNSRNEFGCQHFAFPCSSALNWTTGQCFGCNSGSKSCPPASVGYPTDSSSTSRGKYFFGTRSTTAGQLCGSQYMISLKSNVNVQGNVTLKFFASNNSISSTSILVLNMNDKMLAGKPKQTVVVLPWNTKVVTNLRLLYSRRKAGGNVPAGPQSWTLTAASVTSANGKTIQSVRPIVVPTEKEVLIEFK